MRKEENLEATEVARLLQKSQDLFLYGEEKRLSIFPERFGYEMERIRETAVEVEIPRQGRKFICSKQQQ